MERISHPDAAEAELDIAADPERVWQALTTGPGLAPWMGEGASLDPKEGGAVVLPDPVGGVTRRGRVDGVEHGHRLDFAWWPVLRPAEQTRVSITVTPIDGGTRVRVVERPMVPAPTDRSTASASALAAAASASATAAAGSVVGRSLLGAWSWRLALLSVGCRLSRV